MLGAVRQGPRLHADRGARGQRSGLCRVACGREEEVRDRRLAPGNQCGGGERLEDGIAERPRAGGNGTFEEVTWLLRQRLTTRTMGIMRMKSITRRPDG